MLLEIAVGDAYGLCFESCDKDEITPNNTLKYHDGMPPSFIKRGCYSDDGQMSIAIAECILNDEEWTAESVANRFVTAFKRDPRRGYTGPFYGILKSVKDGSELLKTINGDSKKSGAAMRAMPCGLYFEISEVIRRAEIQAKVTHNSWVGINSAICTAMMAHYFIYDIGPKHLLCHWLKTQHFSERLHSTVPFEVEGDTITCWTPIKKRVSTFGWDVIEAVIYAIEQHDSMKDILWQCCEFAGDTDTVAAIAMGVACWSKEIKQNLPDCLISTLENGSFGRDYLISLDKQLKEKFNL